MGTFYAWYQDAEVIPETLQHILWLYLIPEYKNTLTNRTATTSIPGGLHLFRFLTDVGKLFAEVFGMLCG